MKWTPAQEDAVNSPVSDILVTAAAGAGKTQVLSGRIARRVAEGADISSVLVITFTRAAAAEMRDRVGELLKQEASKNPENEWLYSQLALLPSASITTMHSFCLSVLRSYFYLLDIDPGFRMADPAEAELLKLEAAEDCMEQLYSSDNPAFLRLVDGLCTPSNDNRLCDMILDIWEFSKSRPFPERWLKDAANAYKIESLNGAPFISVLIDAAKESLTDALCKTQSAAQLAEQAGNTKYFDMFTGDILYLTEALDSLDRGWDAALSTLSRPYPRKAIVRGEKDETIYICDSLRDAAKTRYSHAASFFTMSESDAVSSVNDMAEPVRVLCDAALLFDRLYTEKKREKNVLDFSDLEQLTIRVLSTPTEDGGYTASEAAKELRAQYDEIYVDEYQDTNLIQETIVRLICREDDGAPNIFMVGDMKQSIYRFRQTSPQLVFGEKKRTYKKDGPYKKISLTENFRSRPQVLEAINSTFSLLMSEKSGEIEYTDEEALRAGSMFYEEKPNPCAHLCLVEKKGNSGEHLEAEAQAVAAKIESLLSSGMSVYDKSLGSNRPLRASDIAILLRTAKSRAPIYERALSARSVPAFSDVTRGFFESGPVQLFVSLLTVIDNPGSDIDLIAVLRSFLFSFSDPLLADIAMCTGSSFYEKLCVFSKKSKKASAAVEKLSVWREESRLVGASALTRTLISSAGFYEYAASRPGGSSHIKNLEQLSSLADRFEQSGMFGLFSFIRYLENVRASSDMGEARTLSEDMDAVRIMSIHKSKGLEFPVVFVCGAASHFHLKDLSSPMLLHSELGIGIVAVDAENRTLCRLLPLEAIAEKTRFETMSEELRLLYVAMTRAREELYITAATDSTETELAYFKSVDNITPSDVMSATSFLDWVGLAAVRDTNNFDIECIVADNHKTDNAYFSRHLAPHTPKDEFTKKLSYKYEFNAISCVPAKLSVSSIKEAANDDAGELSPNSNIAFVRRPVLNTLTLSCESDKFTGAQRGTIFHYVLENMDLCSTTAEEALATLSLSDAEREAVDTDKLDRFLQSDIFARMKKADKVMREADFTVQIPTSMVDENLPDTEFVLLQGIIDCFFFEGDNIVLVDYKTDRDTRPEVIISRYKKQIELYAYALSKKFKRQISEKYIYLFENCSIIEL